ncbi:ATP-grasp domain-containing protein [Ligilactobacillus acidipiscis]|uniref:ATP-grasp domain-containing protein n=1 Tax=Ligilactobacillus acidipiscis TaxID=89059 RepID=A0A921F9W5_9LACO|nr:ATP-grasp domain-containing protein [Ligilactobacillus acidipiscis]WEV56275.1 ATP-grasp domain-containing protein [Ligilactobacillus acidipiscis]HJE96573.1 ATP-grasp domain-containing protein [Ligilactobacillus acidipiscis]
MAEKVIFPNSTIGVIGSSPNGIALVRKAKQMGFKTAAYGSNAESPTLREADLPIVGRGNDQLQLQRFAERCDLVVYESEQVSSESIKYIQKFTSVPQGSEALELMQDRLLERAFFEQLNVNIAPYATIVSLDDIYQAISSIGFPCVLKPIQKGLMRTSQFVLRKQSDIAKCAELVEQGTFILESWIPYQQEISVVLVRDQNGTLTYMAPLETYYKEHRLIQVVGPAEVDKPIWDEAKNIATLIGDNLNYVGVIEVGFFVTQAGAIYVKRIVPAIHEAGDIYQYISNVSLEEEQLRAAANMPIVLPKVVQKGAIGFLQEKDFNAIKTQWILKENWFYNFFRYPASMLPQSTSGFVFTAGQTGSEAKEQLDSTGIWDGARLEEDKNE